MNKIKSLKDISWNVTEEEYRADKALSYSTLAKYERGGFNSLSTLFDKVESPSLTFGSAVDAIITGGQQEFEDRFVVAEFPSIPDSIISIVKDLFNKYKGDYTRLDSIPEDKVIQAAIEANYQSNWRPETRAKVIKEKGSEYYSLLYISEGKTLLDTQTYQDICNAVDSLKNSSSTKYYFAEDNPFEPIERCYQLKFKANLDGIDYRCMFDLLLINYEEKTIQPIDLKTSYKKEWDFYKSFVEWNYQLQNRLYVRILKANIEKDDYFRAFKILPYKDIVVCGSSLCPLVWDCDFTFAVGELKFGLNNQIVMRDPEIIGKELNYYLTSSSQTPIGINRDKGNDLRYWLNRI